MVSTCQTSDDLRHLGMLVPSLQANAFMVSAPCSISRRTLLSALGQPELKEAYSFSVSSITHSDFGGATPAQWRFVTAIHRRHNWVPPPLRKPNLPTVTIFNMIDDKIGGGFKSIPQRAFQVV